MITPAIARTTDDSLVEKAVTLLKQAFITTYHKGRQEKRAIEIMNPGGQVKGNNVLTKTVLTFL